MACILVHNFNVAYNKRNLAITQYVAGYDSITCLVSLLICVSSGLMFCLSTSFNASTLYPERWRLRQQMGWKRLVFFRQGLREHLRHTQENRNCEENSPKAPRRESRDRTWVLQLRPGNREPFMTGDPGNIGKQEKKRQRDQELCKLAWVACSILGTPAWQGSGGASFVPARRESELYVSDRMAQLRFPVKSWCTHPPLFLSGLSPLPNSAHLYSKPSQKSLGVGGELSSDFPEHPVIYCLDMRQEAGCRFCFLTQTRADLFSFLLWPFFFFLFHSG